MGAHQEVTKLIVCLECVCGLVTYAYVVCVHAARPQTGQISLAYLVFELD